MKIDWRAGLGQTIAYAAFAVAVGYFASAPAVRVADPMRAQLKLSLSHGGAPVSECRRYTAEELARLPPNMRRPLDCPRARVPVLLELEMDGRLLYRGSARPTGLWRDGPSTIYRRFAVEAGPHALVARLRDSRRTEGFDYVREQTVALAPRQNLVIDFRADKGGFQFH